MKLLEAFGIDYHLIIINLINFAVLLLILRKLAYQPILDYIAKRKKAIADGIMNGEKGNALLKEAEAEHQKMIVKSHQEAQIILERTREATLAERQEIIAKAEMEASQMLAKAKKAIDIERQQAMESAKAEILSLVMIVTEKALGKKIDTAADQKLIAALIRETQ